MSITADLIRGNTDTIILAQLYHHDSYGYEINKNIKNTTDSSYELKEATLYTAFKRLEDMGCISSYWGDENIGARRKYYRITMYGKETYRRLYSEWQTAKNTIDSLITEEK
jgi:DNA-binding PadR family transcriptional regulator